MDTIASRLKEAMRLREISQTKLAELAGLSQGTVGNIAAGIRDGLQSLPVIATALRVRYEWLRFGEEPMNIPTLDWPFEGVDPARFAALSERQKGEVEAAILSAIQMIEARAGKQRNL